MQRFWLVVGLVGLIAIPRVAAAQEAMRWPPQLQASGFVDTYVAANLNDPAGRTANLRAFDTRSNELALNLAELAVWSAPEPIGFRLDLDFGPTADVVAATDPAGAESIKHIQQAYGSAKFPLGRGLTLDVGKMVTMMGHEVIETRDNWHYSRSLLFTWAIPFYHFGVRATYPWSDALSTSLMVVNGWNNTVDNNDGKTVHAQVAVMPGSKLMLYLNYVGGPEQPNDDDLRHTMDVVGILSATDRLSLALNADWGRDEATGDWTGVAACARVQLTDWMAAAARGEWYRDEDGATTTVAQTVTEGTVTLEARYAGGLLARLEYRHDQSTEPVFAKGTLDTSKSQDTVTLGTVIGF